MVSDAEIWYSNRYSMRRKLISIFKKKRVWIPLAVIIIIVGLSMAFSGGGAAVKTVAAQKGTVISEVSLTGKVKPVTSVDLAFERSGRMQTIAVKVGDKVAEGQTLLELENADARSQVSQAQAQYDSQLARLNQLKKGASSEDLAVSETLLQNAQRDLENAKVKTASDLANVYKASLDTLQDAYIKSEDAVRSETSDLFLYDETASPKVSFETTNADAKIMAGSLRYQSGTSLDAWKSALQTISADQQQQMEAMLSDAQSRIRSYLQLFSEIDSALNSANGLSSATLAAYKTSISTGRGELSTALAAVSSKEQAVAAQKNLNAVALNTAESAVQNAQRGLDLKKSGSTAEEIAYQEAQVANAAANVSYMQSQLAKTIIRAPFNGTITKLPYEKGDIVQPQGIAVGIIGTGAYQIETNVTESDIAKIHMGDTAKITLDAYSDDVAFEAKVVQIDLSETIVDSVPTYKTTLQLVQEDPRIVSGMTANIDIVSEQKDGVLFVPTRNILSRDGKKFVKKVTDEKKMQSEEAEIQTGLRGSDGRTEVLSGLSEGDKIIAE